MIRIDIDLPIKYTADDVRVALTAAAPVRACELGDFRLIRRTLVSNGDGNPHYRASVALDLTPEREASLLKLKRRVMSCPDLAFDTPAFTGGFAPVVVGAGPAGLFAALTLAESGANPILLERGLPVEERTARVDLFNHLGILDPECNVQFGEGGAGTYSDGKLKSGAMDKYKQKALAEFVAAGATEDIMYSSTAHLGTDKLPSIVREIRKKIESLGGTVIFGARMTDIAVTDGRLTAVTYEKDGGTETIPTRAVILATGHSAHDTIKMLHERGLSMQARGFGIGLRIEHPREYINEIVYKNDRSYIEETASYHLVTHLASGRSVYSFCMCPGGTVVAAASEQGGIVTNGMSEYDRLADNSNSALLVSVTPADFASDHPLAGFDLQRKIERSAFDLTTAFCAPTFRLDDFMMGKGTTTLASVKPSYPRGTVPHSPTEYLPDFITDSLKMAMPDFDAWLGGYYYPDATLTGPETRTTSPVRILRSEDRTADGFAGIYPAGEGAGYAGGIISSATDGIRSAEALILAYSAPHSSFGD